MCCSENELAVRGKGAGKERRGVAVETVPVIAAALRVSESDVEAAIRADRSDSGKRAVAPRSGDASPAPPPISDVRITDDATDAIVNDAFNPTRHKASDVPPVVEALQRTAALFRDNVDPVAYAARLLAAQPTDPRDGRASATPGARTPASPAGPRPGCW